ncbi:MAG: TonB-dependent receptor [Sphingomonadales bacterium]|nr:TonB-dependent receptor [Sphingomonadales bacterium]
MPIPSAHRACAILALTLAASLVGTARAEEAEEGPSDIVVTAAKQDQSITNAPNTTAAVDAETIRTKINAISVEDTIKYLPGLIVRKRHVGDNFAPIATRTSGLGSSARSLIYADGVLLSALIANNNGNGSPKWQLVSPEEVARVDVLYGPYSAAYSGNAIGAVVNITTHLPDKLEAHVTALGNVQWHKQYKTSRAFGTGQFSGSIGDRIGSFAFFASATHTVSNGQPLAYVTANTAPAGTTGSIPTFNRLGQPIAVLGASDIDHHVEDTFKLKLAYDLSDTVRASYTVGLFLDDSNAKVDTYLRDVGGAPFYTAGFNSGFYLRENRHWAHALSLAGDSEAIDWQVIGTVYDYTRDLQSSPSTLLPDSASGGAGTVQDQAGTGWYTLDGKAAWRSGGRDAAGIEGNVLSLGGHFDRYELQSRAYGSAAWRDFAETTLTAASLGKTRTAAIWAQDELRLAPGVSLTLGARQEWWRAYGGLNKIAAASPGMVQAERRAEGFSPKASLEWRGTSGWSARLSLAQAWRFPTVGELYGATTVGTVLANPNPNLRPERARSGELAIERHSDKGTVRLSLFSEVVRDALISQTGTISAVQPNGSTQTVTATFVQNVDRTRVRGAELAVDRRDVLPGLDFTGSVTYVHAITAKDTAFPAAEGKLLPSVPHWKANAVVTWRPDSRLSLTAAARLSSRNYATLDNSDVFADTYQGFDKFFVVDLRAAYKLNDHADVALGVDNLGNRRYFLFHPFPQRSVTAELHWKL